MNRRAFLQGLGLAAAGAPLVVAAGTSEPAPRRIPVLYAPADASNDELDRAMEAVRRLVDHPDEAKMLVLTDGWRLEWAPPGTDPHVETIT